MRIWQRVVLALTPHHKRFREPVWGAGSGWFVDCDLPDSCHPDCEWMRRKRLYETVALPAARALRRKR